MSIETLADNVADSIWDELLDQKWLRIRDYSVVMQSVNTKLSTRFNETINDRLLTEVVKKDERANPTIQ